MNLTPKEDFRKGPLREAFHDISAGRALHEAIKTAMLHMQMSLPISVDLASAAANQFRMEGVKQFVGILVSLTDEMKPIEPDRAKNLNHRT